MERFKFDFLLHWIWAIVLGILLLTGVAMIGPRFGWVMNYNLALADYLHRTMAVVFTMILLIEAVLEIVRITLKGSKKEPWLIVNKKGFGLFTFITAQMLIISGLYLLHCMEQSHAALAFALIIHESITFAMVIGMVWHLYEKSHLLTIGGGRK